MDRLAITAITDLVLASELFFLAGLMAKTRMAPGSAAWFWSGAMLALATSALLGGIDHGFVEPAGLSRYAIQRSNWLIVGVVALCSLLATARQFMTPRWQRRALVLGMVLYVPYALAVLTIGQFAVVIVGYVPVLLLLLALSIRGLRDGSGSWQMVVGIVVLLVASAVQALAVDALRPLDHDGLYHVLAMAGVPFLYLGGQRLRRD